MVEKIINKSSLLRKTIKYTCFIIVLFYCISSYLSVSSLAEFSKKNFVSYPKITETYSGVFPPKAFRFIEPGYTYYNKFKDPIATFNIINEPGQLMVYKISNLAKSLPLNQMINVEINGNRNFPAQGNFNASLRTPYLQFYDSYILPQPSKNIYLNIDGELVAKIIQSDTLIHYSLKIRGFEASYKVGGPADFFVKSKRLFRQEIPLQILFKRKNDLIYMILIYPRDAIDKSVADDFLLKLINNSL